MTALLLVFNLGYALSLFRYIQIKRTHQYRRALPWKMLTSVLFLAITLCFLIIASVPLPYGWLVLAGLLASLAGDYFLDMKYLDTERHDRLTFLGFGSFIVAHGFFTVAILSIPALQLPLSALLLIGLLALVFAVLVIATEKLFGLNFGRFKMISFGYGLVLSGITLLAGFAMLQSELTPQAMSGLRILFAGLVLFVLSDLVLSHTYFGDNKHTTPYIIANYLLYYGAQWLIAWSVGAMAAVI